MKKMKPGDAMAAAIARAHRSAIRSYRTSSASFLKRADALRRDSEDAGSPKVAKTIRALEKLSAACLAKAADHERKAERRAPVAATA